MSFPIATTFYSFLLSSHYLVTAMGRNGIILSAGRILLADLRSLGFQLSCFEVRGPKLNRSICLSVKYLLVSKQDDKCVL
jgi:hypothetical protein